MKFLFAAAQFLLPMFMNSGICSAAYPDFQKVRFRRIICVRILPLLHFFSIFFRRRAPRLHLRRSCVNGWMRIGNIGIP